MVQISGALNGLFLLLAIHLCFSDDGVCDRRPLGTKADPLPSDGRFQIDIVGITDNNNKEYIPSRMYTVRLYSTDNTSTFIAFTISAREDTKYNEKNPRKPILLDPGLIQPSPDSDTVRSRSCNNSVIQSDITPKTSVEAHWKAPPKDNKCVTIYAVVAVKPDVWYDLVGPLSKQVCEDTRKAEDMPPAENDNCNVCEDARYMLTFEGLWSYNTHPLMFPRTKELARFSDVVGASHSKSFTLYSFESDASQGLKMLAAQGNTTELEMEIREQLGISVRTIFKATSQPKPDMVTRAIFRTSREHHRVSLVTAILPSPDWFLGVSNMELCEISTNRWVSNLTFNLYPLDAGTDSGATFEAPNEDTMPPQPISRAVINKSVTKEQMKPFARLLFTLIRTYITPNCITEAPATENEEDNEKPSEDSKEYEPTTEPQNETPPPRSGTRECPMTDWEEWMPCEGICTNNVLEGYHTRFRYHLVDNVPVRKYTESGSSYDTKDASQFCIKNYPDTETEECQDSCDEEEINAQRRTWRDPIPPGGGWGRK
ncbi:spondin-2-like [Epargyreus clarus]|uniref:spondin-2-like n=1 Tax=Epargyreus clarus TaxID=520877 RepID=UPI003C2FE3F6